MDHKDQHHQHHEKEREEKKKEQKEHEQKHAGNRLPFHPAWFLVVGVILTLGVVIVWMFLLQP